MITRKHSPKPKIKRLERRECDHWLGFEWFDSKQIFSSDKGKPTKCFKFTFCPDCGERLEAAK